MKKKLQKEKNIKENKTIMIYRKHGYIGIVKRLILGLIRKELVLGVLCKFYIGLVFLVKKHIHILINIKVNLNLGLN